MDTIKSNISFKIRDNIKTMQREFVEIENGKESIYEIYTANGIEQDRKFNPIIKKFGYYPS